MGAQRFIALDGLRGVAAICVAVSHARLAAVHGYLAVDLFFIISGFVIANSYEGRLQRGELSAGAFMRVRTRRLYPMLFLGAVLGVAAFMLGVSDFRPKDDTDLALAVVSQFAVIPFLSSAIPYFAFNNPPWSITWEYLVNFAHALGAKQLGNRTLLVIVAASALGLVATSQLANGLMGGCMKESAWLALPRATFGYFLGIYLRRTMPRWAPHVPSVPLAIPALSFIVLVNVPPSLVPTGSAWGLYDSFAVIALFGPLVMLTARATGGWIAAALGTVSYPLYVINEPVVFALHHGGYSIAAQSLALVALVLAAWAIGNWVDEPLNRWRRHGRAQSSGAPALAAT